MASLRTRVRRKAAGEARPPIEGMVESPCPLSHLLPTFPLERRNRTGNSPERALGGPWSRHMAPPHRVTSPPENA